MRATPDLARSSARRTHVASDELLEEHGRAPDVETVEVAPGREQVEVRLDRRSESPFAGGRDGLELALDHNLGLDLEVLSDDFGSLGGRAAEVRKSRLGFVVATLLDEPSRRVRHPEERDAEHNSREDLDPDRYAPSSRSLARAAARGYVVVGVESRAAVRDRTGVRDVRSAASPADVRSAVSDRVGEEDAERDRELLDRDERAAKVCGREL